MKKFEVGELDSFARDDLEIGTSERSFWVTKGLGDLTD